MNRALGVQTSVVLILLGCLAEPRSIPLEGEDRLRPYEVIDLPFVPEDFRKSNQSSAVVTCT